MMRSLIILANSRKKYNRCIAGIDPKTGEWIRPVYGNGEHGVPELIRHIGSAEPRPLDILAIPLAGDGPHRDIQPENRSILKGEWKKVGEESVQHVSAYCQNGGLILHNPGRRINLAALREVPEEERASLCLIRAHVFFFTEAGYCGKRVSARFRHGHYEYTIPVTDYEYEKGFPSHSTAERDCLLTISLGAPFEKDNCCYKLAAGVIEL